MNHCVVLVNTTELISKFAVGQKKTQSFVFVSISVIIEGLFDFHDFLLHSGKKRSGISLFFVGDRLLHWIIEERKKPGTTHLGEESVDFHYRREV